MYIQVRTADACGSGSQCKRIEVSKLTTVKSLKVLVEDAFEIKQEKQRLFFRGKELVDNHTIFDYNINLNDVVLLMKRAEESPNAFVLHEYFKAGDEVDALWNHYGAWFEGCVVESKVSSLDLQSYEKQQSVVKLYAVSLSAFPDDPPTWIPLKNLRPRMHRRLPLSEIKPDDTVLVNYNILNPTERGYWYDFRVSNVKADCPALLKGTLLVGEECLELADCSIKFISEVFEIQKPAIKSDEITNNNTVLRSSEDKKPCVDKAGPKCHICMDDPKCKCKSCSCFVCGGKQDAHLQIICDECDQPYHIGCLDPPMDSIPQVDYWFCSKCKNDDSEIVRAGENLKRSKKKLKMPSSKAAEYKRDWGKGMACVGRTKHCTIVPQNHFGPIPGIEVGSCWMFRVSLSEAGIHRPPVAGIHGKKKEGAFSLVLSGGYEDDVDHGEEFFYTGSGGRDLSGNKRTAKQSCDQTLTNMNLALALNCNAPINKIDGAEAEDWKGGKPVRVVRNYKAAKHSEFAPKEGNRYDGIYKVVKYFPQKGESGFTVWRYLLRRDDPIPAPWTEIGRERIRDLGLKMIYPDGYEDVVGLKHQGSPARRSGKSSIESPLRDEEPPTKRRKVAAFELSQELIQKIKNDSENEKIWIACKMKVDEGKTALLDEIQKQFMCTICQDLVVNPITTICHHNICELCLRRSFAAKVYTCPCCRFDLGKSYKVKVNESLSKILQLFFPGYHVGR